MALVQIQGLEQRVEVADLVTAMKTVANEKGIVTVELGPVTVNLSEPGWSKRNLQTGSKAWGRGAIWYIHPKTQKRVNLMIEGYLCDMTDGSQAVSLVKSRSERFLELERFRKVDSLLHETLLELFPVLFREYHIEDSAPKVSESNGDSSSSVTLTPHWGHRAMGTQSCSAFVWSQWAQDEMTKGNVVKRWHSRCMYYKTCEHAASAARQRVFINKEQDLDNSSWVCLECGLDTEAELGSPSTCCGKPLTTREYYSQLQKNGLRSEEIPNVGTMRLLSDEEMEEVGERVRLSKDLS